MPFRIRHRSPARPAGKRPGLRFLLGMVLILNLVVAAIAGYSLKQSQRHYNEQAIETSRSVAKILDENLTGIVAKVDVAMLAVVDEAERQLAAGGIRKDRLDRFIVREHTRIPEVISFRATDPAGSAIYGPEAVPATTSSLAHRDYFQQLRDTPGASLTISKPLVGGISGKWMVVLARRINRPDGGFAGLVYTGVAISQLTAAFADVAIGEHRSIACVDSDTTLVARYPGGAAIDNRVGLQVSSRFLRELIGTGRASGTYRGQSPLDGIERVWSVRRLALPRPFYIVVGIAPIDYLAAWWSEAWKVAGFMVVFLVLTVLLGGMIQAGWRRHRLELAGRARSQAILARKNRELEASLARAKRLEGLISICSYCKKIHNEEQSWEQLERYISAHSDALFSHGICPDCARQHFDFPPEPH
jgi:hypothetical protein